MAWDGMARIQLDGLWMRSRIQAARRGDRRAIEFLCEYFEPGLRRYVERRTSSRIRRWVEPADIVQLVLTSVFCPELRLPEGACGSDILKRLRQMARWRICDSARYHGRDLGESVVVNAREREPAEAPCLPSASPLAQDDWPIRLRRLVSELPERYREAVRLRLAGLGYAQIGRLLALTPEAARTRYRRGVEFLRRGLRDPWSEAS